MITPGIYLHFKGGVYEVLHTAKRSSNPAVVVAVYRRILSDGDVWTRRVEEFDEQVEWPGSTQHSRFVRIGNPL